MISEAGVQEKYLLCQEENEQQAENCVPAGGVYESHPGTEGSHGSGAAFHGRIRCKDVLEAAWELDKGRISSTSLRRKSAQRLLEIKRLRSL